MNTEYHAFPNTPGISYSAAARRLIVWRGCRLTHSSFSEAACRAAAASPRRSELMLPAPIPGDGAETSATLQALTLQLQTTSPGEPRSAGDTGS